MVGRRRGALEETVEMIKKINAHLSIVIEADITTDQGLANIASNAGRIDVLCNNAGASDWGPWQTISLEKWRNTFAVNVEAPFRRCQIFAPSLMERGHGRSIRIGTVYGGRAGNPALCLG